ncbi:MAG: hypothetical protein HY974_02365 [Candidatus Kerfeldbacteria bacterium]|nr:hypothetical protein [Candidatus Kerfeldbacteria bacterium]
MLVLSLGAQAAWAQNNDTPPAAVVYLDHFYFGLYPSGHGALTAQGQGPNISVSLRQAKVRLFVFVDGNKLMQWANQNPIGVPVGVGSEISLLIKERAGGKYPHWRLNFGAAYTSSQSVSVWNRLGMIYTSLSFIHTLGKEWNVELTLGPALGYHASTSSLGGGMALGLTGRAGIRLPL